MNTYLVSGDADIEPTGENLRRRGRTVLHGGEIGGDAANTLVERGRFVIIAHGDSDGTVFWSAGDGGESPRWLWVGMNPSPQGTRVYLYCCKAGPELSTFLRGCECIGHCDVVPMPVEPDIELVIGFLDEVDRLMNEEEFHRDVWRTQLLKFVTERFDSELLNPTSLRAACIWLMLSRSLQD